MTEEFIIEAAMLAAMAGAVGAFAGFIAGLLGVGGGIVVVPTLFFALGWFGVEDDLRMHIAVATSLATIIPTSIISARSHAKRGSVDTALLRRWAPAVLIGAVLGTALAGVAQGAVLTAVFGIVAAIVGIHMAFTPPGFTLDSKLPGPVAQQAMALPIGGFSAIMGIGGGTLCVPLFSLFGYPIKRAVGTSSTMGVLISVPGTIGFIIAGLGTPGLPAGSIGYVNLAAFAAITPTMLLAVPWGAWAAHAMSNVWLKRSFGAFLTLTAARMLYRLF